MVAECLSDSHCHAEKPACDTKKKICEGKNCDFI